VLVACTRALSPRLAECELTHLERQPLDVARAGAEHASYLATLRRLGLELRAIPDAPEFPDGVFVEDTAVVLDELAVIARPGAESRRGEVASVVPVLAEYRPLVRIEAPGTLDGGDVLVVDRTVYVGRSSRSNAPAIEQLGRLLAPHGYRVVPVDFEGCLHLKSAATRVARDLLLVNPAWVDPGRFEGLRSVAVDPDEPHAANALAVGAAVVHPRHHAATRARLEAQGLTVIPVDVPELAKAEAGVTCCSLIFRRRATGTRADFHSG
jgi:dimethylargininase